MTDALAHSSQVVTAKRRSPSRGRCPRTTLLLVEDDNLVREATTQVLEARGYRVLAAATDEQALWLWNHHRSEVDLMISDLMIPLQSTGADLARKFTAEKPGLPVILTSGFGRDITDDDPLFPAQFPFMQKPFAPEELQALITELLEA